VQHSKYADKRAKTKKQIQNNFVKISIYYSRMTNIVAAVSATIGITLSSLIIYYLVSLERLGCACAMNFKRNYILGYNAAYITYTAVALFMGMPAIFALYVKYPLLWLVPFMLFIGGIANVVFVIQFVNELKREDCACSDSVYKDVMYILSILHAIVLGATLLLYVFLFSSLGYELYRGKMSVKNVKNIFDKAVKQVAKKK
jgi:hypothetical protein